MYKYIFLLMIIAAPHLACCQGGVESVPSTTFSKRIDKVKDAVVLDVRTPEEFREGHLSAAVNIDVDDDGFDKKVESLDRNKTYFVYCKAGVRSERAAKKMKEKGFKKVVSLKGGIEEWKDAGLPVEAE